MQPQKIFKLKGDQHSHSIAAICMAIAEDAGHLLCNAGLFRHIQHPRHGAAISSTSRPHCRQSE